MPSQTKKMRDWVDTTTHAQDRSDIIQGFGQGFRDPEQEPSVITSGSKENDASEQSRSG